MIREGVPWALCIFFFAQTDSQPPLGTIRAELAGYLWFIFHLVNRFFEKWTCDAAAPFANLVKWHSLKVKDAQSEIFGFEVCSVGSGSGRVLIYHMNHIISL